MNKHKLLTPEQHAAAKGLLSLGMSRTKVARTLKISERALLWAFFPDAYERRAGIKPPIKMQIRPFSAPPEVLEERDRRLSIERDPITELMGDPPRGYSALDQKRRLACSIA